MPLAGAVLRTTGAASDSGTRCGTASAADRSPFIDRILPFAAIHTVSQLENRWCWVQLLHAAHIQGLTTVTSSHNPSSTSAALGRAVVSVATRCLLALSIISILVCLPAFHSATNLHGSTRVVDAFDLGVDAPESNWGGQSLIVLGALLLVFGARCRSMGCVRFELTAQPLGITWRPTQGGICSPRLLRHSHTTQGQSDEDAAPESGTPMLRMVTTPWNPETDRGTGGSFVARESALDRRYDRYRQRGVDHAFQT